MASLTGLIIASSALAQSNIPPSYGYTFVTVGAPGNRAMLPSEGSYPNPNGALRNTGAVNYEYRISRTETTANQWLEFVNAYWPYYRADGGSQWDSGFTSNGVEPSNYSSPPPVDPGFFSFGNIGTSMSWRMAARYCNWLHNGKALTRAAFESGAYDTSTFGYALGGLTDQPTHSPGARYWIPTLDEWIKATYYDPNRYGAGQGGYWQYSGSSATRLIAGAPGVGQTNAGTRITYNVGSYPNVQSPWGLLDTSGGAEEWLENFALNDPSGRFTKGASTDSYGFKDQIDSPGGNASPQANIFGLRIASSVPASTTTVAFVLGGFLMLKRRR